MRGSEARLLSVVACLHAKLLGRSRPLWALHVIDGLSDGGVAVFARLHHALLDGQGAVALARVLLDIAPGVPIPAHVARAHPTPSAAHSASAFARVGSALLGLPQTLRAAWSVAPQMIDSLRDSVMLAQIGRAHV